MIFLCVIMITQEKEIASMKKFKILLALLLLLCTISTAQAKTNKKDVYNIKNNAANVGAYSKCRNFVSTNHQ